MKLVERTGISSDSKETKLPKSYKVRKVVERHNHSDPKGTIHIEEEQ